MKDVHLRAMEPEDLDFLYHIENDANLWEVGVTNVPYSRYLLHEYMSSTRGDIYADQQVRLIVELDGNEVIGIADIINFDARHCRAELGIVIAKKYRRQGYATEVIRQMSEYACRVLHLHQLYACISADNESSVSLFSKVGFRQIASLPDWLYDGKAYHSAVLMQLLLNS